jgi:subtilisin family serine protease
MAAVDGGRHGTQAQALPQLEQTAVGEDVSAARRFGVRRAWARKAWRARIANRKGKWHRDDIGHERPGKPGGGRPGDSVSAPDGKPGPRDHVRNADRDGKNPGPPDNPPGKRDPDSRPRPPDGVRHPGPASDHVICIGGRVLDGGCTCDGARERLSQEQRVFRCRQAPQLAGVSVALPSASRFGPGAPAAPPPERVPPPPNGGTGSPASQESFVSDEVLVTLARAAPESLDNAVAQSHGLALIERRVVGLIDRRIVRYRIADGRPVTALVSALRADPRVLDPQPNHIYRAQQDGLPRDRAAGLQYALSKLDAVRAQTLASGHGALVAVIDTGVDRQHPDLAGAILDRFDAIEGASAEGASNADPHGTAIAGIIAANGILRGVAPQAKLLDVRAFAPARQGASAATTMSLVRGMEWAVGRQARILNMSFAGPKDALMERAVTAASQRGAIMVAAAGNGGAKAPFAYPAAYPQVIAVTAIDFADRRYAEANQGRYIAVAAPGVDVLTASADHAHRLQSGTSFAAAHVSGILALMLERDPALTADAARHALMTTCHDLGPPGPDDQFGVGRPDAFAALGALVRQ